MNNPRLYRSDIDGLRAIAVLSVVLFHIDASWVSGGFVGVDIFFVISGFLITRNILSTKESGRFSLKDFYRRRIIRIIPALSTVIITTLIAAQFVFLPEDLERLSSSAIASQLSVANIYFTYFLDTSYFAQNAQLEPLLHVWSLGVEEQFYIFWPVLLVAASNHIRIRILWIVILAITIFSFVISEIVLDSNAKFSYYMLPSRAGELLMGALVYFALRRPNQKTSGIKVIPEIISFMGVFLITSSLFLLSENSAFPGYNAIAVTLGTALLIFGNGLRTTLIAQMLSWQPLVAIGLVSYSLYLWHWPVLAFAQYIYGELTAQQKVIAILIMMILTLLSYFFVEKPTRRSDKKFSQIVVRQFLIPTVGIVILATWFISTDGLGLYEVSEDYHQAIDQSKRDPVSAGYQNYICAVNSKNRDAFKNPKCIINGKKEPRILLWGDSHAQHYVGMLGEIAEKYEFSFRNITHAGCPPVVINPWRFSPQNQRDSCATTLPEIKTILDAYDVYILGAAWEQYLIYGPSFIDALKKTIELLLKENKLVLVLGEVPLLNSFDRMCERKALKLPWLSCKNRFTVSKVFSDETNSKINTIVNQFSNAYYFEPHRVLCEKEICRPYINNKLVYFDSGHLSMYGSVIVGREIKNIKDAAPIFEKISSFRRNDEANNFLLPWNNSTEKNQLFDRANEFALLPKTANLMSKDRWHGETVFSQP